MVGICNIQGYPDENLEFESYSPLANVDPEKYAANGELVLKK